MNWTCEFEEYGGYDCMTSAFKIRDNNKLVVVVDCADFGEPRCANDGDPDSIKAKQEAGRVARLIAKAPEMAELLELICKAESSAPNEDAFHGMIYDIIAEARQLLASIEGEAKP